jgi:hypothetical protein
MMNATEVAAMLDLQGKLISRGMPARLARAVTLSAIDRVGTTSTDELAAEFVPAEEGGESDTAAGDDGTDRGEQRKPDADVVGVFLSANRDRASAPNALRTER